MNVKELINLLKQYPKDLDIKVDDKHIRRIEISKTGDSGYEVEGEVRLIKDSIYDYIKEENNNV